MNRRTNANQSSNAIPALALYSIVVLVIGYGVGHYLDKAFYSQKLTSLERQHSEERAKLVQSLREQLDTSHGDDSEIGKDYPTTHYVRYPIRKRIIRIDNEVVGEIFFASTLTRKTAETADGEGLLPSKIMTITVKATTDPRQRLQEELK